MSFLLFLYENGIIERDILDIAQNSEYINNENLDEFLMSASNIPEDEIAILKARYYGVNYVSDDDLLDSQIPTNLQLSSKGAIPYSISRGNINVAVCDMEDLVSIDRIKKTIESNSDIKGLKIKFGIAKKRSIENIVNRKTVSQADDDSTDKNFIDKLIAESVEMGASDIHISPYENTCEIKRRVNCELSLVKTLPIDDYYGKCVTIKVMAKLDISENRRPQSGHFQRNNVDFRISTQPTLYGENISIRILNKNKQCINIENIGFSDEHIEYLRKISNFAHGMIIFCGPTGSGKTTSIYSMLSTIDRQKKNIMTLEDPIEYRIHGVKQTDISDGVIDFATGVSSILRQDPDVILIGEIRDSETAHMAIRASMTGHLVFTTIHANDSIGAIKRFQDFGISPFLVADNIISIISQRIVRKTDGGITIVSEIIHIDETMNNMIYQNASRSEIMRNIKFKTLIDDCREKVMNGIISKEEMDRILRNV